jgi:hypothetical protein
LNQQSPALLLRRLAPWAVFGLLVAGCLVDKNDKCGDNQVLANNGLRCVCAEGFIVGDTGCVPCGDHEVPDPIQGCACDVGYARSGTSGPCTELPAGVTAPTGVGTPCASDADCAGFDADYCELAVSHTCLVQHCTPSPNSCFTGFDCCDFSRTPGFESLPTLCLASGLCPP